MHFLDDDITPLVEGLNPAQREAVTAPPEHRLVLAGAGSGKTRVLVHRVAWLISVENVSPHSVLAVTFTNKAAHEMRQRLEQLLQMPVRALWVGTFHGIAHRMLRLHYKEARLVQTFQIMDADDQQRFVKRLLRGLDLPDDRWPPKTVTAWINAQKEEARRPEDFDDRGDFSQRQLVRIYSAYQNACDQAGLVDFAELLLRAFELCRDVPGIRQHYRSRFRHVLVDEFQDTNTLQYQWLRVLAGDTGKLFVVGDDDQSVYSWRGARVENLAKFTRDFPGSEVVRLEQNYRSTGTILKAANALITRNSERMGKELWTDAGEGEPIQLYAAFNDQDESEFVVNRVREAHERGMPLEDMAVLYRSNAQSRVLEEALIRAQVNYRIYGGLRFFERMEIKDALAYMRLVANRDDDAAFERVVNTPTRGIGSTSMERLRALAREQDLSLWAAASRGGAALGRAAGHIAQFLGLIERIEQDTREQSLQAVCERSIELSGLREHYRKDKSEQADARLENLDELINAARGFQVDEEDGVPPLLAFLTHAALEAGERQSGEGEDCVQLMSLHAAKGLEFPLVFMVGLEEGLFPHIRAVQEGNIEEERRLCYVGITRARERLFVSYAEVRRLHGQEQVCMPSRFVREIPGECVVETRPRSGVRRPMYTPRPTAAAWAGGGAATPGNGAFKLGSRVRHPRFGEGVIIAFDGDGDRTQVEIAFQDVGSKRLILRLAKLEAL